MALLASRVRWSRVPASALGRLPLGTPVSTVAGGSTAVDSVRAGGGGSPPVFGLTGAPTLGEISAGKLAAPLTLAGGDVSTPALVRSTVCSVVGPSLGTAADPVFGGGGGGVPSPFSAIVVVVHTKGDTLRHFESKKTRRVR